LQLASLAWDKKMRTMWFDMFPERLRNEYKGGWTLTRCDFNPDYYELDPSIWTEDFRLIGSGAQGTVSLDVPHSDFKCMRDAV